MPRKVNQPDLRLRFHSLTPDRWRDLTKLFGERGACGGCWCMTWRLGRGEFEKRRGESNRRAFQRIVRNGDEPGVLAYDGDEPIGWCAVQPREVYTVLVRSRTLAPVDDRPVWSVTCFFIKREFRRRGVSVQLLKAAAKHAKSRGAKIVEGYPVEPRTGTMPDAFAWTGLSETFRRAGFKEVERRSPTRPIMRLEVARGR